MARSAIPTICPIKEVLDSLQGDSLTDFEDALRGDLSSAVIASWAISKGHKKAGVSAVAMHRVGQCECRDSKDVA